MNTFVNGIGNVEVRTAPPVFIPHCSKANGYVFQRWPIQMRQAKSYLAFRCEIPKYIIHVILFAKGCISSTHYSCSYRSIISCCKWYRKYAYCYISWQTCRTSPLLPSYSEQPWRLRSVPAIIIIPITKSVININVAYAIDESFTVIWWNYIRII